MRVRNVFEVLDKKPRQKACRGIHHLSSFFSSETTLEACRTVLGKARSGCAREIRSL